MRAAAVITAVLFINQAIAAGLCFLLVSAVLGS